MSSKKDLDPREKEDLEIMEMLEFPKAMDVDILTEVKPDSWK
jgi:hypothetical protein